MDIKYELGDLAEEIQFNQEGVLSDSWVLSEYRTYYGTLSRTHDHQDTFLMEIFILDQNEEEECDHVFKVSCFEFISREYCNHKVCFVRIIM